VDPGLAFYTPITQGASKRADKLTTHLRENLLATTRILVIDDEDQLRESLQLVLADEGYDVFTAATGEEALELLEDQSPDLVLCDLCMPGIDGMELLPRLTRKLPNATLILMSAYGSEKLALEAIRRGAYDYLAKPFLPSEMLFTLRKAKERENLRRQNLLLQREVARAVGERPIVAASEPMIDVLEMIERTAEYKTTVLLEGESGTGKEVLARAVHSQSTRRNEPFIAINCAAIPENLLESELFGYAKGAFTGANKAHRGIFEEANGGTIFLDEIGELPLPLQAKLLRVLQEEEIRPVGDAKSRKVDVRIIAATIRNLEIEASLGNFREDLFYRLNVVRIVVPPLRERRKDIPLLIDVFLDHFQKILGKPIRSLSNEAYSHLVNYYWPGNVRELENVIERAIILCKGDVIGTDDLTNSVTEKSSKTINMDGSINLSLKTAKRHMEEDLILKALKETEGNRTHAAKLLGISHRSLLYKLKEYSIRNA
jgi:two-component system response regulator AtoC